MAERHRETGLKNTQQAQTGQTPQRKPEHSLSKPREQGTAHHTKKLRASLTRSPEGDTSVDQVADTQVNKQSTPKAQFQVAEPQMMKQFPLKPLPAREGPAEELPDDFWTLKDSLYDVDEHHYSGTDHIGPFKLDDSEPTRRMSYGSQSFVMRAMTPGGEKLALKIGYSSDPAAQEVFAREKYFADLAHNLSSGVPELLDAGTISLTSKVRTMEDYPYLLYRYIPGTDLRHMHHDLSNKELESSFGPLAETIDAFGSEIVHRDLGGHNIRLESAGQAWPIDFGYAAHVGTIVPDEVANGTWVLGYPDYHTPEHYRAGDVFTASTNTYQFGLSLKKIIDVGRSRSNGLKQRLEQEVFSYALAQNQADRPTAVEFTNELFSILRDSETSIIT